MGSLDFAPEITVLATPIVGQFSGESSINVGNPRKKPGNSRFKGVVRAFLGRCSSIACGNFGGRGKLKAVRNTDDWLGWRHAAFLFWCGSGMVQDRIGTVARQGLR